MVLTRFSICVQKTTNGVPCSSVFQRILRWPGKEAAMFSQYASWRCSGSPRPVCPKDTAAVTSLVPLHGVISTHTHTRTRTHTQNDVMFAFRFKLVLVFMRTCTCIWNEQYWKMSWVTGWGQPWCLSEQHWKAHWENQRSGDRRGEERGIKRRRMRGEENRREERRGGERRGGRGKGEIIQLCSLSFWKSPDSLHHRHLLSLCTFFVNLHSLHSPSFSPSYFSH